MDIERQSAKPKLLTDWFWITLYYVSRLTLPTFVNQDTKQKKHSYRIIDIQIHTYTCT